MEDKKNFLNYLLEVVMMYDHKEKDYFLGCILLGNSGSDTKCAIDVLYQTRPLPVSRPAPIRLSGLLFVGVFPTATGKLEGSVH